MSKILVIDDERSIRNTLKDILEYEKYEVDLAEDGNKGVEKVKGAEYDIVLCDIKMPGMDGIEALEKILAVDRRLPVVIHSAYSNFKDNYLTWTAADYVVKSGNLAPLKQTVKKHLERV